MDEDNFPVLKAIQGCDIYSEICIKSKKFTIGRALGNNFVIPVIQLSRNHCVINCDDEGKWSITDTSSFGTLINGIRIEKNVPKPIEEGDSIQFGPDSNRYKYAFEFVNTLEPPEKKAKYSTGNYVDIIELESEKKESERRLEIEKKESERKLQLLEEKLKEKERENEAIIKKLQETEENRLKELEELKKQQENEKAEILNRLQDELKAKEDAIRLTLQQESEKLEREKAIINENIQKELAKKEGESAKYLESLQEELDKVKKDLDTVNGKKQMLETELNSLTNQCQENQELMLKTKTEVLSELGDVMETELQCSICNELFIETTTLNCMHSYCQFCILQWQKKQNKCPICRKHIKSLNRTIVVDSFINKIVESLPEDMRKKRLDLVNERKQEDAKRKFTMKFNKKSNSTVQRHNTVIVPATVNVSNTVASTSISNNRRVASRRTYVLRNENATSTTVPTIDLTNVQEAVVAPDVPDASNVVVISSDPNTNLNATDMEVIRQFISSNHGLFF